MLRAGTQDDLIRGKVNMPTAKSHAELVRDVEPRIKAQAFFSARVAEAHILDRLREVSDGYSRGEFGLGEARNRLKDFLRGEGYDPHQAGMRNLASTARLNLILKQNAAMANAAAEWQRMHSPEAMKVFPYVRYHARHDDRTRSAHGDLDGRIFRKDDPFLRTHTPPWEFNCRCYLEEITEKEAGRTPDLIRAPTPEDKVTVDSESGFSFDPEHAFEKFDLETVKSRASIIAQAEPLIARGEMGNCGLICAPQTYGEKLNPLPGADDVRRAFSAMQSTARQMITDAGFSPDHLPDYETVNRVMGKNIPKAVRDLFPEKPLEVGHLSYRAQEAVGVPDVPVMLGQGNDYSGITHLWRNHKDIFVDPDKALSLLKSTLGDSNCRVVVSLKHGIRRTSGHRQDICLKRIVLHNEIKGFYCVMVYDEEGKQLKLVSWHDAPSQYGDTEWALM